MSVEAELVVNNDISRSFPDLPEGNIVRENFIDTIENLYTSDKSLIVVQGEDGIGKTTLLRQFITRHPRESFGLFIKGESEFAYNPKYLIYQLANQIHWYLVGSRLEPQKEIDYSLLTTLIQRLKRYLDTQSYKYVYFIIDGLDDIDEKDNIIKEEVLKLFPFGIRPFRFLISGKTIVPHLQNKKSNYEIYHLSSFGPDEVLKYFKEFDLDTSTVKRLRENCKGLPGFLFNIRQLMKDGADIEEIIGQGHSKLQDLYEVEWKNISLNSWVVELLIHVSLEIEKYTVNSISTVLNKSETEVSEFIYNSSYLEIDKNTKYINFASNTFKNFVFKNLKNRINELKRKRIEILKGNEKENLLVILNYYDDIKDKNSLLEKLSPSSFLNMLDQNNTFAQIRRYLNIGILSSKELHKTEEEVLFALYETLLNEKFNFENRKMEIVIAIRSNDIKRGLLLAQNEINEDERFHLLAICAREIKKKKLEIDKEIIDQVRTLFKQMDFKNCESKIFEIASDLMFSCPDLAISMIESKSAGLKGEDAFDHAIASASTEMLFGTRNELETKEVFNAVKGKIKNEDIKELFQSIYSFVHDCSADNVLMEAQKLEKVSNKMLLLRSWSGINEKNVTAFKVIEYALDNIMKSMEFVPTADLIREIITPLPYILDIEKKKNIIGIIDGQNKVLFQQGLTEEYFRIQLLLMSAEWTFDKQIAKSRLDKTYYGIFELTDLSLKATCLAWCTVYLELIDPDKYLEKTEQYHSLFIGELNKTVDEILNRTAEHYVELRHILKALAKTKVELAFSLCKKMNIERRRNDAISYLISEHIDGMGKEILKLDVKLLLKIIDEISDLDYKNDLLAYILTTIVNRKVNIENFDLLNELLSMRTDISAIPKTRILCSEYILGLRKNENVEKLADRKKLLFESLNSIDDHLDRINELYWVAKKTVNDEVELTKACLEKIKFLRTNSLIDSYKSRRVYVLNIKLLIRIFGEIILNKNLSKLDLEKIHTYIENLPSNSYKSIMWAYLASYYYEAKDDCEGRNIAINYIQSYWDNIPTDDIEAKNNTLITIAPILYKAHPRTTKISISGLDRQNMNIAYYNIITYIFNNGNLEKAYEIEREKKEKVDYEDLLEIIELAKEMTQDNMIFSIIKDICDVLSVKTNYDDNKRSDVIRRLKELLVKFPDANNITHDGYIIASLACFGKLEGLHNDEWDNLLRRADKVVNISDRTFIYSIIIEMLPTKYEAKRKTAIDKVKMYLDLIPSDHDRLERCEILVNACKAIDSIAAKEILKVAVNIYANNEKAGSENGLNKIVNMAYKLDQKFASSLVTIFDADPARLERKMQVERELDNCKTKGEIGSPEKTEVCYEEEKRQEYPRLCFDLSKSIKAKKRTALSMQKIECLIEISSKYSFNEGYPIMNLVFESMLNKANRSKVDLIKMKETVYNSLDYLIKLFSINSIEEKKITDNYELKNGSTKTIVNFQVGERDKAIGWIKDWINTNLNDTIIISDAYLEFDDLLWLLKCILDTKPFSAVKILTSKNYQRKNNIVNLEDTYREKWLANMDCDPPLTEITIPFYLGSEDSPIHDRYIICGDRGLFLGTSLNYLCVTKGSGINELNREGVGEACKEVMPLFEKKINQLAGKRIVYSNFTL